MCMREYVLAISFIYVAVVVVVVHVAFNHLYTCTCDSMMRTLAKSEDADIMPQSAALNNGLHCLLKQNFFQRNKQIFT